MDLDSYTNKLSGFMKKGTDLTTSNKLTGVMSKFIIGLIIVMSLFWFINKTTLKDRNCKSITSLYADNSNKLHSINSTSVKQYALRDYYIKTAYNCCATGQFKNDYVDSCALKNAIKQGARCLDFEIYTVNNEPVVATSSVLDRTIKETYNSLTFTSVLSTIMNNAFSSGGCSNSNDPLILHLRMKTNIEETYNKMAEIIKGKIEPSGRLLDKKYSYEFAGEHGSQNLGAEPICNFLGKVIIIVNKSDSNVVLENTELDEFTNMCSGEIFMRAQNNHDVQYASNVEEIKQYNKKCMTLCMPDLSPNNNNINSGMAMSLGCQMVAMNFPNFDSNIEHYCYIFDKAGTAFVVKPEYLRYTENTVAAPTALPDSYNFAPRKMSFYGQDYQV